MPYLKLISRCFQSTLFVDFKYHLVSHNASHNVDHAVLASHLIESLCCIIQLLLVILLHSNYACTAAGVNFRTRTCGACVTNIK